MKAGAGYMTLIRRRRTAVAPKNVFSTQIRGCDLSLENAKVTGRHQGHP